MRKIREVDNLLYEHSSEELYQLCFSFPSVLGDAYHHLEFYTPIAFISEEDAFVSNVDFLKLYFESEKVDPDFDLPYGVSMFHVGTFCRDTGKSVFCEHRKEIPIYCEGVWFNYEKSEEE